MRFTSLPLPLPFPIPLYPLLLRCSALLTLLLSFARVFCVCGACKLRNNSQNLRSGAGTALISQSSGHGSTAAVRNDWKIVCSVSLKMFLRARTVHTLKHYSTLLAYKKCVFIWTASSKKYVELNFFHLSLKLGPGTGPDTERWSWQRRQRWQHSHKQTLNKGWSAAAESCKLRATDQKKNNQQPVKIKKKNESEKSRLLKSFVYFMCLLCAPFAK